MSATTKKTGKGGNALKYYILGTELGLSGKLGQWYDPSGIFAEFGVVTGNPVGKSHMIEMMCLSRGLNPVVSGTAFNQYGSFDPSGFMTTIWESANRNERKAIAKILRDAGVPLVYATSSASRIKGAMSSRFSKLQVDEVIAELLQRDPALTDSICLGLLNQGIQLKDSTNPAEIVSALVENIDTVDTVKLVSDIWGMKVNNAVFSEVLGEYGIQVKPDDKVKAVAKAVNASGSKFNVDADEKSAAQIKLEAAIFKSARAVKSVDYTITRGAGMQKNTGDDFTFEAPKDVSVIWAMSDDATRKKLENIMLQSAHACMDYFNKYAGYTRKKGPDGLHAEVRCQHAASIFIDFTGRPVSVKGDPHPLLKEYFELNKELGGQEGVSIDPHLHAHIVKNSSVKTEDGAFLAHETKYFRNAHQGAMEAGHAELARLLHEEFGLTPLREKGKMAFRLAEVERFVVEAMSKRHGVMLDKLREMNLGDKFANVSKWLEERIFRDTRSKHITPKDEDLDEHWLTQGDLLGFGREEVMELLARTKARQAAEYGQYQTEYSEMFAECRAQGMDDVAIVRIIESAHPIKHENATGVQQDAPTSKTERTLAELNLLIDTQIKEIARNMHRERGISTFSADALRAEVQKRLNGWLTPEDILHRTDIVIATELAHLGRYDKRDLHATSEWIALEATTVDLAVHGRHKNLVTKEIADTEIARMKAEMAQKGHQLTEEQEAAIRYPLQADADKLVTIIEGPAGSGKTTILLPVVRAYFAAGYTDVRGCALSWGASVTLRDQTKLNAIAAVEMFAQQIKRGTAKLTNRSICILDEGSLTGSEHYSLIINAIADAGGKLLIVGDTRQINAVAAGGMLNAIVNEKAKVDGHGSFRLREIRRQKDPQDSAAALAGVEPDILGSKRAVGSHAYEIDDEILERIKTDPANKNITPELLGSQYSIEWDKKHKRLHIDGTLEQSIESVFTKYVELLERDKHKSLLILAHKNKTVDLLNEKVRQYMKDKNLLPKEHVQINVRIGDENKTTGFAVGDYVQFRKKTIGTSKDDQAYNRTRAKILEIKGTGDDAVIKCQIYVDDTLSDRIIEISKHSFKEGKIYMQHAYATSIDSSQGMTVDATVALDEAGVGQQRKYVMRTRSRNECHTYCNLDTLHQQAANFMDADAYTNRNKFTQEMAEEILAVKWARSELKGTTLDYITDRKNLAGLSCLEGTRFAKNATIADAIEKVTRKIYRTRGQDENPEDLGKAFRERPQPSFSYGDAEIPVKSSKPEDLKEALKTARETFGNVSVDEIKINGGRSFKEAAKSFIGGAITKVKEKFRQAFDNAFVAAKAASDLYTKFDDARVPPAVVPAAAAVAASTPAATSTSSTAIPVNDKPAQTAPAKPSKSSGRKGGMRR